MITLVDRLPVKSSTLEKLRRQFDAALASGRWAVVPESGRRRRNLDGAIILVDKVNFSFINV
jgi:hypothetical protein